MKNKIVSSSNKGDSVLSVKRRIFTSRFTNKKIGFNSKPFKKMEQSEDKQHSIHQNIQQSYLETVREIDDSFKNPEKNIVIKNDEDIHNEEKLNVSLVEPTEPKEIFKDKLKQPAVKKLKAKKEISDSKKRLRKKENKNVCPIYTEIQPVNKNDSEKELVNEKKGFGWKGLGSRRIVFDDTIKEYRYKVIEPELDENEVAIKNKIIYLFRTNDDLDVFDMNDTEKIQYLEGTFQKIIDENNIKLKDESKDTVFYHIFRDFLGYGIIDILMHDEEIEDISCDGYRMPIFIFHNKLESITSNISFTEADALDSYVVRLSQMCGKQISVYEPIVDGKLSDGSRLQTTLGKTVTNHSTFTIRKFREDPLTPIDLIANNTISLHMAAYFWMAIEQSSSILFCGGTATGKTTMLNALSLFLPSSYKIVSIEDTREINLPHENWIAGTTRTGFSSSEAAKTGKDVDMFDLVRVALRQRPQAIIVGEVRGKEAYVLFQAMTTGHLSYSTVHASNLHALIQRLLFHYHGCYSLLLILSCF